MKPVLLCAAFLAVAVPAARAHDPWDSGSLAMCADDDGGTCNQLRPGEAQVHDLQGTAASPDYDWILVATKARRSYEVDVRGGTLFFAAGPAVCDGCPRVALYGEGGLLIVEATSPDFDYPVTGATVHPVLRWVSDADVRAFVRVAGAVIFDLTANDRYDVVLRDTTLAVPRWNSTGSQATVLLVSNQAPHAVAGSIFFYDGAGTLRHTEPLSVPRQGLRVVSTAAIPALAGLSGSATVAHDGGWGALAGKAVALEPATGFTFDTAMTYVP